METLINIASSWFGLKPLWSKIDGYKTYIAGVSLMLGGLATMFTGISGLLAEFLPLHDFGAVYGWIKAMGHDTNAGIFLAGYASFHEGLKAIGLRHAIDKQADAAILGPDAGKPAAAPAAPIGTPDVLPATK